MSKVALGLAGAGGVAGTGAFAAYQGGLFSTSTVRETLTKEGYELVNTDEQFKSFFTEFKSDGEFMKEVNKHKQAGETLEGDDGTKGKLALKALCSSYLDSKDKLDNAIKWCVLRIQDKQPSGKTWITDDGGSNGADWKNALTKSRAAMVSHGVEGISLDTQSDQDYSKIKEWCLKNKKLPINTKNKTIQSNASSWCSK
ncbi:hypothetical protein MHF_0386 [Mycoplasma haemofelis Ohio2]|uniref:Uncharacterized protein n=1 Tax=Mycoplasma haemofelis (strain Ohio2) TaxID=859194 RepID=F6FH57_MYCHI|nr:hypothetical protein MHF_0386 [Mycoplasma haemofelis Ohio2]